MSHSNFPNQNYQYPQPSYTYYPANYFNSRLALSTGLFGVIVGATLSMGNNIHKVQSNQMTWTQAGIDSLVKGGMAGVATFAGTSVAQMTGTRGVVPFLFMAATATGVGYLMSYIGKPKTAPPQNSEEQGDKS